MLIILSKCFRGEFLEENVSFDRNVSKNSIGNEKYINSFKVRTPGHYAFLPMWEIFATYSTSSYATMDLYYTNFFISTTSISSASLIFGQKLDNIKHHLLISSDRYFSHSLL